MKFRKMTMSDVEAAAAIAAQGKALLKSRGVSQWQAGPYPDRPVFLSDVEKGIGYVVEEDDQVIAVCAVTFTEEACYKDPVEGKWLTSGSVYATIHRSAVSENWRGRHVSAFLFGSVLAMARDHGALSVRVDTHQDNSSMRKALSNAGFAQCTVLRLVSGPEAGDLRIGYEKLC